VIVPPPLYAVKVWVNDTLRDEMRLSGREKRGRVFLETNSRVVTTFMIGLQQEIYGFFSALKKNTFLLTASLQRVGEDGTLGVVVSSSGEATTNTTSSSTVETAPDSWPIACDADVLTTFQKAIPVKEFASAGVPINNQPAPPFRNLHVRVRTQVVRRGLRSVEHSL
jgi:hypothetical protein